MRIPGKGETDSHWASIFPTATIIAGDESSQLRRRGWSGRVRTGSLEMAIKRFTEEKLFRVLTRVVSVWIFSFTKWLCNFSPSHSSNSISDPRSMFGIHEQVLHPGRLTNFKILITIAEMIMCGVINLWAKLDRNQHSNTNFECHPMPGLREGERIPGPIHPSSIKVVPAKLWFIELRPVRPPLTYPPQETHPGRYSPSHSLTHNSSFIITIIWSAREEDKVRTTTAWYFSCSSSCCV